MVTFHTTELWQNRHDPLSQVSSEPLFAPAAHRVLSCLLLRCPPYHDLPGGWLVVLFLACRVLSLTECRAGRKSGNGAKIWTVAAHCGGQDHPCC